MCTFVNEISKSTMLCGFTTPHNKIITNYSHVHLTYGMEVLLPIELEVMTLHIATILRLPLDES